MGWKNVYAHVECIPSIIKYKQNLVTKVNIFDSKFILNISIYVETNGGLCLRPHIKQEQPQFLVIIINLNSSASGV